ncbi:MAG: GNAT family N-acetyltransferase, partial [Methanolinea sp.]
LEARLRESEELYRGIFDNSEAGMLVVARAGEDATILEANWNAARLCGTELDELPGTPLSRFLGSEVTRDLAGRLDREGKVYGRELELQCPGGKKRNAILSAVTLPGNRAALSLVDITARVTAEEALRNANRKLHHLSRISSEHLQGTVTEIGGLVQRLLGVLPAEGDRALASEILEKVETLARQIRLSETYRNLGTSPPRWIRIQEVLRERYPEGKADGVSVRYWAERLCVYADPLFGEVILHLVDNAVRHGRTAKNVVVSYRETPESAEIYVEDDGVGIPPGQKEEIFAYDSGKHPGLGLFVCRQIASVTGMTIEETGREGSGARFVIRVPRRNYRIEGTGEESPPVPAPRMEESGGDGEPETRELLSAEFPLADEVWMDYHQAKGDPVTDRIFATFSGGRIVSLARCRRHPDGFEVDAVFTPPAHRGKGYARRTVGALVEACGHETLYMHSVLNLTEFYGKFGFRRIREDELPPTIRERFAFAGGELEMANVCPMMRTPPP